MAEIINQLCLSGFNLINSRIDAFRILKHKTIAHGINFGAYVLFTITVYYLTIKPVLSWCDFPYLNFSVYLVSAFCNRQITFDIPLNLRRGLKWYHVSQAEPPAAWLDRQERKVFGKNGRAQVYIYSGVWIACTIITLFA